MQIEIVEEKEDTKVFNAYYEYTNDGTYKDDTIFLNEMGPYISSMLT